MGSVKLVRKVDRPRNGGQWTEARYKSFITGALRQASNRWPPKFSILKQARVARGLYQCVGYKRLPHNVRAKEINVDHIDPVVDPATGFIDWNTFISRLFVEQCHLQALCDECHNHKSKDEKVIRKNGKASRD